ncbi:MAG TPA: hypothetical protein VMC06_03740 [Opitutaceae bacterium]|nr:hypothetical protein [Opitutaceae bacterium]
MTRREAKLVLTACRSNGADAVDPLLAEALACARQDPNSATWFLRQQQFDAPAADKLSGIAPPPALRDEILGSLRFPSRRLRPRRWLRVRQFPFSWASPPASAAGACSAPRKT